jgi:hypothetical protein
LPSVSVAELLIAFNTLVEVSHFKPDSRGLDPGIHANSEHHFSYGPPPTGSSPRVTMEEEAGTRWHPQTPVSLSR